jgi:hypothetical protein
MSDGFEIIDVEDEDREEGELDENQSRSAAPISYRVNSTINPNRPRTLRAGYDSKTGTLTVIFRDGTWWNYYKVPHSMWEEFRSAKSKGRYLASSGLDQWPDMGEPSDNAMTAQMMRSLDKTRLIQKARGGKQSKRLSGAHVEAALKRYMKSLGQGR